MKLGLDLKLTREYDEIIRPDFNFLRLRISDRFRLQGTDGPSQLERNQELIFRLIAIDMESGRDFNIEFLRDGSTALDDQLLGWRDGQLILLARAQACQE